MISGWKCSAQLLDRLLVVDAEVVLERDDLLARGGTRAAGAPPCRVPDRGVHDVEDEDREDLDPPVEDVAVAAARGRRGSGARAFDARCSHAFVVSRLGGVADRLRVADRERRARRACSRPRACIRTRAGRRRSPARRLTPRRVQEQHERAFAHAEPAERDRQHLQHRAPRATNASTAAIGTGRSSARKMQRERSATTESW